MLKNYSSTKPRQKIDYLIFFTFIPLFLNFLFLFPQECFILQPSNPTLISIYFSNFVHTEIFHFAGNLIYYFLFIFLIFKFENNRKRLYVVTLTFVTILPILNSLLIVYTLPNLPPILGFSAIDAGFLGYLLFSVYNYIKYSWKISLNSSFLWSIFLFNISFPALYYIGSLPFIVILAVSIFFFLGEAPNRDIIKKPLFKFFKISKSSKERIIKIYSFLA